MKWKFLSFRFFPNRKNQSKKTNTQIEIPLKYKPHQPTLQELEDFFLNK